MKRFLTVSVLLLHFAAVSAFAGNRNAPNELMSSAQKVLPGIQQMIVNETSQRPVMLKGILSSSTDLGDATAVVKYMKSISTVFQIDAETADFQVTRQRVDNLGMKHVQVNQTYKGVPVFGSEMLLHAGKDGILRLLNGQLVDGLDLDITPAFSAENALAIAERAIGPATYRWDIPEQERIIKEVYNDISRTWRPQPQLVIAPNQGNFLGKDFRLAYKILIPVEAPTPANWTYFVDAKTGEVINRWNSMESVDAVGSGPSLYSGTVTFHTNDTGSTFQMYDATRNIRTYNANNGTLLPGTLFTDADNVWDASVQQAAVDAHWGATEVYDYYFNVHGRNGLDNLGSQMNSSVHYSSNYNNAAWNGAQMLYGDGDGVQFSPLVTLDVCGHEFTHGVTENESALIYQSEPGALNEALSDIFGTIIEFYAKPTTANWLIGEECYTPSTAGDALRYMNNPNLATDPDTYEGTYWASTANPSPFNDYGGVHTNSGVLNYCFYLLTDGGSGTNDNGDSYTVTGIGIDKSRAIFYRMQTTYLTASAQFADARTAAENAATDLYGAGSNELLQVQNAWYAVGVGSGGGANTPPVPTISQPSNGATLPSGQAITFAGDASDAEDGTIPAANFTWRASGPGIPANYVIATGVKSGTTPVPPTTGSFTITLEVHDSQNATASTSVNFTVSNTTTVPSAPSGLSATAISSSQINLSWTDNANNESGFRIERKTGVAGTYAEITTVGANVTSYANTGLAASTTYYYRVRAYNSAGNSGYSNEANATTSGGGTNQPPVVTITQPVNGSSYTVGQTISFAGDATDPEDGVEPASRFTWSYRYNNGTANVLTTGVKSGSAVAPVAGTYILILQVTDSNNASASAQVTITVTNNLNGIADGGGEGMLLPISELPQSYTLLQNYPNPFNPETMLTFATRAEQHVVLEVYDVIGHKVKTLVNGQLNAGVHSVRWTGRDDDGKTLPSGIYYARLQTDGQATATLKMLMMK